MEQIRVIEHTLSDGSKAYTVQLVNSGAIWDAISLNDATELADKLMKAIDKHTTEKAEVWQTFSTGDASWVT